MHNDYANGGQETRRFGTFGGRLRELCNLRLHLHKFMQNYAKLCKFMQKSYAKSCSLAGSCIFNFYAASKGFTPFLSKIWVVSLHCVCPFVKLYIELVYPIIDYCSVCSHQNSIGYSTSIFRNHNLESFCILAWFPRFLQCIMLAHQAALYIKLSTSIEVINNNRKPYWLNESKS